jgi:hypothetical protein
VLEPNLAREGLLQSYRASDDDDDDDDGGGGGGGGDDDDEPNLMEINLSELTLTSYNSN